MVAAEYEPVNGSLDIISLVLWTLQTNTMFWRMDARLSGRIAERIMGVAEGAVVFFRGWRAQYCVVCNISIMFHSPCNILSNIRVCRILCNTYFYRIWGFIGYRAHLWKKTWRCVVLCVDVFIRHCW